MDNIIYFDDECLFCNTFIFFLIELDKNNKLYYSSLKNLDYYHKPNNKHIDSIILVNHSSMYIYSDAIIRIFEILGFKVSFLFYIPKIIRDILYKIIAKYRRKIWNNKVCKIPDKNIRYKFLDY